MSKRASVCMSRMSAVVGVAVASALLASCQTTASAGNRSATTMRAMDANQDGRVTKDEYLKYQEQQFDRIDKDKSKAFDESEWMRHQLEIEAGSQ